MSHVLEVSTSPSATFTQLVDDILVHILCILSVYDVLQLRVTCSRLEAISRRRSVWLSLFARHVVENRLPVPGFLFVPTPRLTQLLAWRPADSTIIQSADIEARTIHALRLRTRWTNVSRRFEDLSPSAGNCAPEVHRRTFMAKKDIKNILLLPGGRMLVSIHVDRLCCWDLGTSRALGKDLVHDEISYVCEYEFERLPKNVTVHCDARTRNHFQYSVMWNLMICDDTLPSWSSRGAHHRQCEHLALQVDYLPNASINQSNDDMAVPSISFVSRTVPLPDILPTPIPFTPPATEELGPQRFASGKLGELIFVYGNLLFFASYTPPRDSSGPGRNADRSYVGIEVIDMTMPEETTLMEYPDPMLGAFVGMHVHEHANKVLVVWQNCAGLYSLPQHSLYPVNNDKHSKPFSGASDNLFQPYFGSDIEYTRRVRMPDTVFALNEPVEAPVAFSFCNVEEQCTAVDRKDAANARVPPLTIIARARDHSHRTVQSVLIAPPLLPHESSCTSFTRSEQTGNVFRLLRIPLGMPRSQLAYTDDLKEGGAIVGLVLGSSGNGILAREDGSISRCIAADVVLPFYDTIWGDVSPMAIKSVDPSSWRETTGLPASYPGVGEGVQKHKSRPIIRFDDGMGRVATIHAPNLAEDTSMGLLREVTILDFS